MKCVFPVDRHTGTVIHSRDDFPVLYGRSTAQKDQGMHRHSGSPVRREEIYRVFGQEEVRRHLRYLLRRVRGRPCRGVQMRHEIP